jgi:hypothetical protein
MDLIGFGARRALGGIRSGDPRWAAIGALAVVVGLLRRLNQPKRVLLYSQDLKPGAAVRIQLADPIRNQDSR